MYSGTSIPDNSRTLEGWPHFRERSSLLSGTYPSAFNTEVSSFHGVGIVSLHYTEIPYFH